MTTGTTVGSRVWQRHEMRPLNYETNAISMGLHSTHGIGLSVHRHSQQRQLYVCTWFYNSNRPKLQRLTSKQVTRVDSRNITSTLQQTPTNIHHTGVNDCLIYCFRFYRNPFSGVAVFTGCLIYRFRFYRARTRFYRCCFYRCSIAFSLFFY